jgi:hypothetical protein
MPRLYSYSISLFLLGEPTFFNPILSLDVSIFGRSFSGCQAADSVPLPQHSKLIFNPFLCPDYILTRSLSLFLLGEPTFFNPILSLDVSISGRSFSVRQTADSVPSPQHSKLIFNPVLCPDYILTRSLSFF